MPLCTWLRKPWLKNQCAIQGVSIGPISWAAFTFSMPWSPPAVGGWFFPRRQPSMGNRIMCRSAKRWQAIPATAMANPSGPLNVRYSGMSPHTVSAISLFVISMPAARRSAMARTTGLRRTLYRSCFRNCSGSTRYVSTLRFGL